MKTILVIEDNLEFAQTYEKRLTQEGFNVCIATTGQQGLDLIKANQPDLILLDLMLPGGMNGFDVLERLKRNVETTKIPVIVVTNMESEKKSAMEIGANDYLVKANTSLEDLVQKVKNFA